MATRFDTTCFCGAVRLAVDLPTRRYGARVICARADQNTEPGPAFGCANPDVAEHMLTTPDCLTIVKGVANLEILRAPDTRRYFWYAACCGAPMIVTPRWVNVPFVRLPMRSPLSPELSALPRPLHAVGLTRARVFIGVLERIFGAVTSGRAFQNPLLDDAGHPVAPVGKLPSLPLRAPGKDQGRD